MQSSNSLYVIRRDSKERSSAAADVSTDLEQFAAVINTEAYSPIDTIGNFGTPPKCHIPS